MEQSHGPGSGKGRSRNWLSPVTLALTILGAFGGFALGLLMALAFLDAKFERVHASIDNLAVITSGLEAAVNGLQTTVSDLKTTVANLETEQKAILVTLGKLEVKVGHLEGRVANLETSNANAGGKADGLPAKTAGEAGEG